MKDEDLQFDRTCHVPYAFICRLQQAFLETHFALVICCIGKEVQRME